MRQRKVSLDCLLLLPLPGVRQRRRGLHAAPLCHSTIFLVALAAPLTRFVLAAPLSCLPSRFFCPLPASFSVDPFDARVCGPQYLVFPACKVGEPSPLPQPVIFHPRGDCSVKASNREKMVDLICRYPRAVAFSVVLGVERGACEIFFVIVKVGLDTALCSRCILFGDAYESGVVGVVDVDAKSSKGEYSVESASCDVRCLSGWSV